MLLPAKKYRAAASSPERRFEMDEDKAELGNLHNDLLEEVLRRVPLNSLTRLKCVNVAWNSFITRHLHCNPPATSTGLVFLLERYSPTHHHESAFFRVQHPNMGGPAAAIQACYEHQFPYLLDSCNGFLLYATKNQNFWTYHISRPLFLDDNHEQFSVALPAAHSGERSATVSLSFKDNYSFRVLCFFTNEVDFLDCKINLLIFSSKSWDWREKKSRFLNLDLLLEDGFIREHCFGSRVYCRRKLYLLWSKCMLIYDEDREISKLVRLPGSVIKKETAQSMQIAYLSRFLWESEGVVHFSDPVEQGFYIWAYNHESEEQDFSWHCKKLVVLNQLRTLEIFDGLNTKLRQGWGKGWTRIRCCMFNEDLQVLYLLVPPGVIVSYSFETQKMAKVWCFSDPRDTDCRISSCFPFLYDSLSFVALRDMIPAHLKEEI